ncbi:hypothetical protein BC940DRAFT_354530 [Gongronella butleri]|nr:hypothetical protein BC940DRAFT_354530 [Gongronella butleri]
MIHDKIVQRMNVEQALCAGEASKEAATKTKFFYDHCKLLVEGKVLVDQSVSEGCYSPATILQLTGLEALVKTVSLSAPGLYVATQGAFLRLPRTKTEIHSVQHLCAQLWQLKNIIYSRQDQLDSRASQARFDKISAAQYVNMPKSSSSSLPISPSISWMRTTWYPPQPSSNSIPFPPPILP